MPKFDVKEHEKRMLALIKPRALGSPIEERVKAAIRKRRLPKSPSGGITSGV